MYILGYSVCFHYLLMIRRRTQRYENIFSKASFIRENIIEKSNVCPPPWENLLQKYTHRKGKRNYNKNLLYSKTHFKNMAKTGKQMKYTFSKPNKTKCTK